MTLAPSFLIPSRGQTVDALPIQGTALAALDMGRVAKHIQQAGDRGRYLGPTEPEAYLLQTGCIKAVDEELYPTLGGLLCFGQAPQSLFPAVVDLGHYYGFGSIATELLHIEKNIGGTIFTQLERVEAYLWANTRHGMTLSNDSIQRLELHEYPRAVLREITVNMLAHRDYTSYGSACRVQLFRDRIEWISPGGLPGGMSLDTLLTAQVSRNPVILTVLYEAGYVEGFGQGLDTVVALLQREGMPFPRFEDLGSFFQVSIYGLDPRSRIEDQEESSRAPALTDGQRRILTLLDEQHDLSAGQIHEQLGDRAERTVQHDLKTLVEAGLVSMVGKARAARYQRLARGDKG